MKENIKNIFFLLSIFLLNLKIINSFGLSDLEGHLLIFFKYEEKKNENKVLSEENYMKELMYKELYSTLNVGLPNQNLKFYYEMNNYESTISEQFYFKKRSMTYKLIDNRYKNISYKNNDFNIKDPNGYLSQDIFEFNENLKLENFTFILKPRNEKQNTNINSLGLNLNFDNKNNSFSYLNLLNQQKLIKEKIFSFLCGDESFSDNKLYDGQILLGYFPHDASPDFDPEGLQSFEVKNNTNSKKWHIEFDTVKYNNDELKDKIVELDINLNIVIGPERFRKKLISNFGFFKEFIDNKKCKEHNFLNEKDNQTYIFYSFDKTVQFKEVPNLFFFSKEMNETFKVSFSELFIRYRDRYYFKIVFKKKPDNKWVLGQLFLNNYKFVFDMEERKIWYYKTYSKKNHPMIVLCCFAVFAIILIFGYYNGYSTKNLYPNLYKNQKRTIPKEYSQEPQNNNKKEDNKINNEKVKKE